MNLKTTVGVVIVLIVLLLGVSFGVSQYQASQPGQYDDFAACLSKQGAKFYGAFWCPHCNDQKGLFGNSAKLLPYVECSNPDGQTQTQVCIDAKIEGYPTWEFADGSRLNGVVALEELGRKTSCAFNGPLSTSTTIPVTETISTSTAGSLNN